MIIHVDTQRASATAPDQWLSFLTRIVGFMSDETVTEIENQPERMLAVIVGVGHAARMIETNGRLDGNKILIQDDRDNSCGSDEQFQLFGMLKGRQKKLLSLGGDYAKYLRAVVALLYYWKIEVGLSSDVMCGNPDCGMRLEAYKDKCAACGQSHQTDWRAIDEGHKRRSSRPQTAHRPYYQL